MNIVWSATTSTQCPKTDNQTGDFSLTATYTGITGAWSFKYSIDEGTEQTVSVASGTTSSVAVTGFANNGNPVLAKDIAQRWLKLNDKVYASTGKMMEKYNVEDLTKEAGGGEYPSQDGFGWTNGVYLALDKLYR